MRIVLALIMCSSCPTILILNLYESGGKMRRC
jgi:hypothetical protein